MYCPECGFHQSEAIHTYCEKCGALLPADPAAAGSGETTGPFAIPDASAEAQLAHAGGIEGPALAVRTGGGLSGQVFRLEPGEVSIGRDPDSDIFLDDVTVSRDHATLLVAEGTTALNDLGSLNGTYVNRRRIDTQEELIDGDELQIGKFRLVFIA